MKLMLKNLFSCTLLSLLCLSLTFNANAQIGKTKTPPGGGGGGGGSAPVYGLIIVNGNAGNTDSGFKIILYEGNYATQDIIANGSISGADGDIMRGRFRYSSADIFFAPFFGRDVDVTLSDKAPANDETRSMKISGMLAGRTIVLYDSPSAETDDDWTEITIKKNIPKSDFYQIHSYEHSYSDEYVQVIYHQHNGLDGKVSYLRTSPQ